METQTTTAEIVDEGKRRDRRGRVSWRKQQREDLLAEYERSGMSQAGFSRHAGVRYPTFAHWMQEARRERRARVAPAPRAGGPRFAEVRLGSEVSAPVLTVELSVSLPGGLIARGADAIVLPPWFGPCWSKPDADGLAANRSAVRPAHLSWKVLGRWGPNKADPSGNRLRTVALGGESTIVPL